MSDTPRTDAAVNAGGLQLLNVVDVSRQLERDTLAAHNAKLREALEACGVFVTPAERLKGWSEYKEDAARRRNAALATTSADCAKELEELRRWKAEALELESMWNEQAIGKLLDLPLGSLIRPQIEPAIRKLLASQNLK
jgi:hypothetical protein